MHLESSTLIQKQAIMLSIDCFSYEKIIDVFLSIIFAKESIHISKEDSILYNAAREVIKASEAWLNNGSIKNYESVVRSSNTLVKIIYELNFKNDKLCHAAKAVCYSCYPVRNNASESAFHSYRALVLSSKHSSDTESEYIHKVLCKNISSILDFHIKEGIAFGRPEVVFQYLNEKEKERFIYKMDILCRGSQK